MSKHLKGRPVLIVDDELSIRSALQERFAEEGVRVTTADGVGVARKRIAETDFALILLDHRLGDGTGLALLEELRKNQSPAAVIMMTAFASIEDAVRAMKAGAADYLIKPFDLDEMVLLADRVLENVSLRSQMARVRAKDRASSGIDNLIGGSPAMNELRDFLERVSRSGAQTILIRGESGTGKDLVARAIHFASPETDAPFLNITCTALPEALLESELFGHEKGAFTDAKQAKRGLFEEAQGGTIFLDEIGDMPQSLQGKLLRFLESKTFRRVGGLREIQVDVRVIAATNRDLSKAIEEGTFRSDLYYRLNVIPIEIPPLRERREDVRDLVSHFTEYFATELRKVSRGFDAEAMTLLGRYDWPGNVRELRNCVERAVLLARNERLGVGDLPREIRGAPRVSQAGSGEHLLTIPDQGLILEDLIKDLLDQALVKCAGNKSGAASMLGIHRDQVRYWVKKYGLTRWIRTRKKSNSSAAEASGSD